MRKLLFPAGPGKRGYGAFPISQFTDLNDTPTTYPTAGEMLQVNATKTGLELIPGRGQINGVASLDGSGLVPAAQIPAIAITEYLGTAANQAAMLALVGQKGDWCIRTDLETVWVITGNDPTQITDWTELEYPVGNIGKVKASATDAAMDVLENKISVSGALTKQTLLLPPETVDLAVRVDGTTIEINGSNNLARKAIIVPFSKEKTIYNPSGITAVVWIDVCRFNFSATVTNVRGKRTGGTSATCNARRNGADLHLAAGVAAGTSWTDGGAVQNTAYVAGDYLQVGWTAVAGGPTQIGVLVDLTRSI